MIGKLILLSFYLLWYYLCHLQIYFCLVFFSICDQNKCLVSQYSEWVYFNFIKTTLLISELDRKYVKMSNNGSHERQ